LRRKGESLDRPKKVNGLGKNAFHGKQYFHDGKNGTPIYRWFKDNRFMATFNFAYSLNYHTILFQPLELPFFWSTTGRAAFEPMLHPSPHEQQESPVNRKEER
jgi:hypothetical protein